MIDLILMRIATATPESPISVFAEGKKLRAVFGSTVVTQSMIAHPQHHDPDFIGSFHRNMDRDRVRKVLEAV